jgi:hypothetical protein
MEAAFSQGMASSVVPSIIEGIHPSKVVFFFLCFDTVITLEHLSFW